MLDGGAPVRSRKNELGGPTPRAWCEPYDAWVTDVGGDGVMDAWSRRSWLIPFLLLCMRDGDLYGQVLLERLDELGFGATRQGEVYRVLRELGGEGLTFSERERMEYLLSRRRYGLTEEGKVCLEFLARSFEERRREIERFFLAYEGRPVHEVYG